MSCLYFMYTIDNRMPLITFNLYPFHGTKVTGSHEHVHYFFIFVCMAPMTANPETELVKRQLMRCITLTDAHQLDLDHPHCIHLSHMASAQAAR